MTDSSPESSIQASFMTAEEENYLRIANLIIRVAPVAVRIKFDNEFDPSRLQTVLNQNKNQKLKSLKRKRVLNQAQWNLLFPISGRMLSETFDLTLMICLIRNLTNISVGDDLPYPGNKGEGADLTRLKYYRNKIMHSKDGSLLDPIFSEWWDEISQAITRLGGVRFEEHCKLMKIRKLHKHDQEILTEIRNLIGNFDPVAKSLRKMCHEKQLEWEDEKVAETRAIIRLKEMIINGNTAVAVGPSGCGKSTAIHYIAVQLARTMDYEILIVNSPEEIKFLCNHKSRQIFVIDDALGVSTFDETKAQKWIDMSEYINIILKCNNIKLLASCSSHIFRHRVVETIDVLFKFSCDFLSINYSLTYSERQNIASCYLTNDEIESLKTSNILSEFAFFPYLCRAYSKETSSNMINFFSNPNKAVNDQFYKLLFAIDQTTFATLFLFVAFNNCVMERLFIEELKIKPIIKFFSKNFESKSKFSIEAVRKEIEKLTDTYLTNQNKAYRFIHNKIFDNFVLFCCDHQFDITLEVAHIDVIRDRFVLQRLLKENPFVAVGIPPEKEDRYFERLIKDLKNGFVQNVFANQNLKDKSFQSKFTKEILEDIVVSLSEKKFFSLLMSVIDRGLSDIVPRLMINELDLNQQYWNGDTPLCKAAGKGYYEVVTLLLKQNADPNFQACSNMCNHFQNMYPGIIRTHFKYHCKSQNMEYSPPPSPSYHIGQEPYNYYALRVRSTPTAQDTTDKYISPLHIATSKGYTDIVKLLLTNNAKLKLITTNDEIDSPLYIASNQGYTDIVRLFLRSQFMLNVLVTKNQNVKHTYDESHLCFYNSLGIAIEKGHSEIVELMLNMQDLSQNQNQIQMGKHHTETLYWNMIVIAVINGHHEVVKLLLEKDLYLNLSNETDGLPLFKSICEGKIEIVKFLLEHKLNPNLCYMDNESPLFRSTSMGRIDIAELLLKHNCSPDICNTANKSPLYIASWKGDIQMVNLLFEYKSDPNILDDKKQSILHVAAFKGHTQIVKLLLDNNCSINVCNEDNETPLFVASMNDKIEIVKLLLDHNSDPNICSKHKESPLFIASSRGYTEIVKLLLHYKSDCNVCNKDNISPFCVASRQGYIEIVELLLDHCVDPYK